jgi:hypothetical protein
MWESFFWALSELSGGAFSFGGEKWGLGGGRKWDGLLWGRLGLNCLNIARLVDQAVGTAVPGQPA